MAELLAARKRSFEQLGVMSMEVFRERKFGGAPGAVPDDGHGDVFLVVDNYAGLVNEYEVLVDRVDRLIAEGPTFGIHVVVAAARPNELRPTVRGGFGSRVELRVDSNDAALVKPRMAEQVLAGRPGRG